MKKQSSQEARQVGKTYTLLGFGHNEYENVAYFNFEVNPKLSKTFEENIEPEYLIPILSRIASQTIIKEKTLMIFDEVQLCECALTSLKYFYENVPEYHIIVAGSLLGIAVNRDQFSFSVGKVDIKTLYPMDMEEFLIASGEDPENPSLTNGTATPISWTKNRNTDANDTLIKETTPSATLDGSSFRINGDVAKQKNLYQVINVSGLANCFNPMSGV